MPRNDTLLAALTSRSPAFAPPVRPAPARLAGELWAALTASTPAFSRRPLQPGRATAIAAVIAPAFGDRAQASALARDQGRGLALAFVLFPQYAFGLAAQIARDLDRRAEQALECTRSRDLVPHGRLRARDRDPGPALYLEEQLDETGSAAFRLAQEMEGISAGRLDEAVHVFASQWPGLQASLLARHIEVLTASSRGPVAFRCGREVRAVISQARILQQGLRRDLSDADLRGADLAGADLDGVLWSDHTRWPLGMLERIETRSVTTGPGTYRIDDEKQTAAQDAPVRR